MKILKYFHRGYLTIKQYSPANKISIYKYAKSKYENTFTGDT